MSASGWIGVDLDGTLAHYEGWNGGKIGTPVPAMLNRVKLWLDEGVCVKIVTARVGVPETKWVGYEDSEFAKGVAEQRVLIEAWCHSHIGQALSITSSKDFAMIELWDDRCVQIEANTGRRIDGKA